MAEPAYTRLRVDERRRQLIDAGSDLFARHAFEEISMQQIAKAAGVSKGLLYHYFPNKTELFKAAVEERAQELQRVIEPSGEGSPFDQLSESLDSYLAWIEDNAETWGKLVQSAGMLPEAAQMVQSFRAATLERLVQHLIGGTVPPPALRTALQGWLGYIDAAILDWVGGRELTRAQLRELLIASFGATLLAAQQVDPGLQLQLG